MYNHIKEALTGTKDTSQHHITLFALVLSLRAKNVLELGVRAGSSTRPILDALFYTEGNLTSVDIFRNENVWEQFKLFQNWEYIEKDSIQFLKELKTDVQYDIVFIDDWHDGKHVLQEIHLLEPHINFSSLILLHDCMCYNTQPSYHFYLDKDGEFGNGGPYGALKNLDTNFWEFSTIPVNNGLTILRKKNNVLYF